MNPAPTLWHQERIETLTNELERLERTIAVIAYSRLASFLLAVAVAAVGAFWVPRFAAVFYAGSVLLLVTFAALVVRHARVEERRDVARARLAFHVDSIAAIRREWSALPLVRSEVSEDHPYALDLDVAGPASLFQLIDRGMTPPGRATLQQWLLAPAAPDVVARRQDAIRALVSDRTLPEDLSACARLLDDDPQHLRRFLAWAEGEPWLVNTPSLLWIVRGLTAASLAAIALRAADVIQWNVWQITATAAVLLTWRYKHRINETFDRAANSGVAFRRYASLIDRAAREEGSAPLLRELQSVFSVGGTRAPDAIHRFTRVADRSNVRYSMALFYLIIQAVTLWDFHVVAALEAWQQAYGRRVRAWLHALAEIEALAAFAALLNDNPSFSWPEVDAAAAPSFDARGLAHPLIADDLRVANDVAVGPPGTFLLITGSNMSGKSTLLRAIGLNAVLAQAGAPVCASALRLSPLRVHTSVHVHDSVAQGVSYFMAALLRLKSVVDASKDPSTSLRAGPSTSLRAGPSTSLRAGGGDRAALVYLLDEVLQGTNNAERQIAVRRIMAFLLKQRAIGAVTTHDLDLAGEEPLASAAQMVHFTETFRPEHGRSVMHFDYKLRPGLATSRNALKLIEVVGLGTAMEG